MTMSSRYTCIDDVPVYSSSDYVSTFSGDESMYSSTDDASMYAGINDVYTRTL